MSTEKDNSMRGDGGPPAAGAPMPGAQRALAVQIMTTEHFTLQSARGAATSESSSRSALFLTVLSAALVAMALAAQVASSREVLYLAMLALGVVFFLGVVTYLRVLENGIEDYLYVKEMNRIRHFYVEVVPETAAYFVLAHHDDAEGIQHSMGLQPSRWRSFVTTASSVGLVDSVVGGVLVALAVRASMRAASAIIITTGVASAIVIALVFLRHGTTHWQRAEEKNPPLFARSADEPGA